MIQMLDMYLPWVLFAEKAKVKLPVVQGDFAAQVPG